MVPFIMLYKVILTFESADKFLRCDHSEGLKVSMPQPFASKFFELEIRIQVSKAIKIKNVDLTKKTWWHKTTSALQKF